MMKIFLYTNDNPEGGNRLRAIAEKIVQADHLVCIDDLSDIDPTLRSLLKAQDIVIFFADSDKDMDAFLGLRSLLQDVNLIVIVTQNDSNLIDKGHLLRPRFLDVVTDNDLHKVEAVLEKMLKKSGEKNNNKTM